MSILSQSPVSPKGEANDYEKASPTFSALLSPLEAHLPYLTRLTSRCNKPMTYTFNHQIRGLVYYHTEACSSAQDLLQAARCDRLANQLLVPASGLGESTFYEANATRGEKQMFELFARLSKTAAKQIGFTLPRHQGLIAIDGSFIDACLSMTWADYSRHKRKAKLHFGFDLNGAIPRKIFLSDGKADERPFVCDLLDKGQTGVMDRGYQDHARFDAWINQDKHFVVRVKKNIRYRILERLSFQARAYQPRGEAAISFFAKVLLGDADYRMTQPVFLVGFSACGKTYWIVTDRGDFSAEEIAYIYSLRWKIETFFAWWKKHLKVYHLISRSPHGVLIQLLAGLITYLLLVIYFHRRYDDKPCVTYLRQLRWDIRHEVQADIPIHIHIYVVCCLLIVSYLHKDLDHHAIF